MLLTILAPLNFAKYLFSEIITVSFTIPDLIFPVNKNRRPVKFERRFLLVMHYSWIICKNSSSVKIGIPSSSALVRLLPAFSPANT